MLQPHRFPQPLLVLGLLLTLMAGCGVTDSEIPSSSHDSSAQQFFGILRTPPEPLRGIERNRILRTIGFARRQVLGSQPQLVATPYGRIWVFITSKHLLCIVQSRGGGCAPIKSAVKQGVYLGVFWPPTRRWPLPHGFLVQGVVPDDVERVSVVVGATRTRVVPVKDNVFSAAAEQPVHVKRLLRH